MVFVRRPMSLVFDFVVLAALAALAALALALPRLARRWSARRLAV